MEFAIILIIVIIFVSVLTGNLGYVLFGMSGLLLLMAGFMILIFAPCCVLLLLSKWKEATFAGIDLPTEKAKFRVAFYLVDGEEIPCLFPEEGIFRDRFYQEDKTYHVLWNRRLGRVFDRFSIATVILGLSFGIILGTVMLAMYY